MEQTDVWLEQNDWGQNDDGASSLNVSEARGDLIQTSAYWIQIPTSQHENILIYTTKAVRSASKQGHLHVPFLYDK